MDSSYGRELENESVYEREKGYEYADEVDLLSQDTDDELIERAIQAGTNLNLGGFPAYDIAVRIKENGWKMTARQREAIINVMAHHHTFGE
jgi:hypothetical protein